MNTCIDFRMMLYRLGHSKKRIHLGHDADEGAAFAKRIKHARGFFFHQPTRKFLPDPFRHQRINLPVMDHLIHQCESFRGYAKPEACGEASRSKDPHRVFVECRTDMTQHACLKVGYSPKRVDNYAILI